METTYTPNDRKLIETANEYLHTPDGYFDICDLKAKAETEEARKELHNMAKWNYHYFND